MKKKVKKKRILSRKEPEKRLLLTLKSRAGRNNQGRITVRHRGGGVKRRYRIVDFGQNKIDIVGKVEAIEYDPYRTAFIMLVEYQDNEKRYRLAPEGIKKGEEIVCKEEAILKKGNRTKIKNVPVGT